MTRSSIAADLTKRRPKRALAGLLAALLAATSLASYGQPLAAQDANARPKTRPAEAASAPAPAPAAKPAAKPVVKSDQKAAEQRAALEAQKAKLSAANQKKIANNMIVPQGALDDGEGNLSDVISEMTEDGKFVPAAGIGPALDPETATPSAMIRPQPRNDKIIPREAIEAAALLNSPATLPSRDPSKGAVTNLPVPRYVTLKTNEGNARRGPGLTHRIDWVFTRAGMPLKLTGEYGHWRRIEDADGLGGWVHYALLSGTRGVIVTEERTKFYNRPDSNSRPQFEADRNVVGKLLECDLDWCRVSIEGNKGWVPISALWGVDPGEIVE